MTTGQSQPLVAQEADDLTGRSPFEKRVEHARDDMLDRTVGIFDDVSIFLAQQTGRER